MRISLSCSFVLAIASLQLLCRQLYVESFWQSRTALVVRPKTSSPTTMHFQSMGDEEFGGYTAKQRLREEIESPFRKVRLVLFGFSTGSALTALYFSTLNVLKASIGTYEDGIPMDEALTSSAINLSAAIVCGFLTFRDYQLGQANLARIKKGGQLARLVVQPADGSSGALTLKDFRRSSRVMIAAGGKAYITALCRQLNADQRKDSNTLPQTIQAVDLVIVPILLEPKGDDIVVGGETQSTWLETKLEESDRNFDVNRANSVIAFPRSPASWSAYLASEIETATSQGFDVLEKGFTILVKKNGRILRRATGLPQWSQLLGAMEVMDGSKFGMPGDDEKYNQK